MGRLKEEIYGGIKDFNKTVKQAKVKLKKQDESTIQKSFHENPEYLYEQIYEQGVSQFIRYNKKTGHIKKVKEIVIDSENTIIPIVGEELQKDAVILPADTEEYGTTEDLDKEIEEHINKWLDVDPNYLRFATWNVRFSWLYDKFNTLNYSRAIGDTGTGKSRFLNVIGNISYKPMKVAGALTPAVIFRIIDKWEGTLLIDEGDQKDSDATNAFIKILNCGYEKGMAVCRIDTENDMALKFFKVYGPKVLTTRNRFTDKATEARCMTKVMIQTNRLDIPDILTNQYYRDASVLRNKLLLYRLRNYDNINPEKGLEVDLSMFEPRLRQVNRGFIGLFSNNEKELKRFKEYLQEYQNQLINERSESFEGGIIQSIADLLIIGHDKINSTMIAEHINQNYLGRYMANNVGVGKKVRSLGLDFEIRKIDGLTQKILMLDKGYKVVLRGLFTRYIYDNYKLEALKEKGYGDTVVTAGMQGTQNFNNKQKVTGKVPCIGAVTTVTTVTPFDIKNLLQHIMKFQNDDGLIETKWLLDKGFNDELINHVKEKGGLSEPKSGYLKIVE